MSIVFSTGSAELDSLLEELRAGDNVVFYTRDQSDYLPFCASLLRHLQASPASLVYVRSAGRLDALVAGTPGVQTLDLSSLAGGDDPLGALLARITAIGPDVYYVFESLASLAPWLGGGKRLAEAFLALCPLLYRLDTVAYWNVTRGQHDSGVIAAIKDCTQILIEVGHVDDELLITPLKVWGRYSEAMFRPHHVSLDAGGLHIAPLPVSMEDQQAYMHALAGKNRELAEIRDMLDRRNQELQQRNEELLEGRQLRSFVEDVITTEEQDSRRLAFDLHDGLVQLIVASYQHLQTAQGWRTRDPSAEEKEVEQGVKLLRRAIYEARRLIGRLRPAGLDDFGLVHALRVYVAQLAADADWEISLEVDPAWPKLPAALEAALFRIVQEATTNALKYAQAPRAVVQLKLTPEDLYVHIQDWGKGFDPHDVAAVPQQGLHMGLVGIRERARLWGGRCLIQSHLGKGTSIEVYIPRSRASDTSEKTT